MSQIQVISTAKDNDENKSRAAQRCYCAESGKVAQDLCDLWE